MFNQSSEIVVRIFSGEVKEVAVRWPTDQEWAERTAGQRVEAEAVTDGIESKAIGIHTANAKLFGKIVSRNTEPALDEFEATAVIEKLEHIEALGTSCDGKQAVITLGAVKSADCPVVSTEHTLRLPNQRQLAEYKPLKTIDGRAKTTYRARLEPSGLLYDALHVSHSGYGEDTVPIIHKDAAVSIVIAETRKIIESLDAKTSPEQ